MELQSTYGSFLESLKNENNFQIGSDIKKVQEFSKVLPACTLYINGYASRILFKDSKQAMIGEITLHNCYLSEDILFGILFPTGFVLYNAALDYLKQQGYSSDQIKGLVNEVNKNLCITIRQDTEAKKVQAKITAQNEAKEFAQKQRLNKTAGFANKPKMTSFYKSNAFKGNRY